MTDISEAPKVGQVQDDQLLTQPATPARPGSNDNTLGHLIVRRGDILTSLRDGALYSVLDIFGSGTFCQVFKCQQSTTLEVVAVKVIKNLPAYANQAAVEVGILELISSHPNEHLIQLKTVFVHENHVCLVFPSLGESLYDILRRNHFQGMSTNLVRVFATQILDALVALGELNVTHGDLKPENVLLAGDIDQPFVKLIDLGSAFFADQTVYSYIQSRFYRSPEVLLGLSYSSQIDTWSAGCVFAELFFGLPLFPGVSEYDQIRRILEMLGLPPAHMLQRAKHTDKYFIKEAEGDLLTPTIYRLKTREEFNADRGAPDPEPRKNYFNYQSLKANIHNYPMNPNMTRDEIECEVRNRDIFFDFLRGLLQLDPLRRWTAAQAIQHPFLTGAVTDPSVEFSPDPVVPRGGAWLNQPSERMSQSVPGQSNWAGPWSFTGVQFPVAHRFQYFRHGNCDRVSDFHPVQSTSQGQGECPVVSPSSQCNSGPDYLAQFLHQQVAFSAASAMAWAENAAGAPPYVPIAPRFPNFQPQYLDHGHQSSDDVDDTSQSVQHASSREKQCLGKDEGSPCTSQQFHPSTTTHNARHTPKMSSPITLRKGGHRKSKSLGGDSPSTAQVSRSFSTHVVQSGIQGHAP